MLQHESEFYFFLRLNSTLLYVYLTFAIHSSADGLENYFCLLAIVNNAAMNIDV